MAFGDIEDVIGTGIGLGIGIAVTGKVIEGLKELNPKKELNDSEASSKKKPSWWI